MGLLLPAGRSVPPGRGRQPRRLTARFMEKSVPVLEDLPPVEGKNVLVRTDFNVPMASGRITDDLRIRLPLETLTWLLDHGAAKVTTASHLGRPRGRPDPAYDLAAVRQRLHELL